jgi:hypothetical protein
VRTVQAINQKMLKGMPSTTGVIRSQRETEKHIPTKGRVARRMEAVFGLLTSGERIRGSPRGGREQSGARQSLSHSRERQVSISEEFGYYQRSKIVIIYSYKESYDIMMGWHIACDISPNKPV